MTSCFALPPRAVARSAAGWLALALAAASPAAAASSDWVGDGHSAVRLVTATDGRGATPLQAGLEFRFASGWHGYWRTPGDAGVPPAIDWSGTAGLKAATVAWPAPSRLVVSGLQNAVYDGHVLLPVTLAFEPGSVQRQIGAAVDYAACSNVCVPVHADLSLPLSDGAGVSSPEAHLIAEARAAVPGNAAGAGIKVLRREIVGSGAERRLVVDLASTAAPFVHPDLFVEGFGDGLPPAPAIALGDGGRTATLTVPLPPPVDGATPADALPALSLTLVDGDRSAALAGSAAPVGSAAPPAGDGSGGVGLVLALLSALLGGLVLNLMPCVLPVLSLKLVGLARHVGEGRRAVRVGLAASGLGILASFLALAAALIAVRASGAAVGWGIQFQQPAFLGLMAALTVLFAASLFDWLHLAVPAGVAGLDGRAPRRAWVQSFLAGAFATLLATPCSAPFVGTAVGFALARGPAEILGIFLCLGFGMALPFFAAALVPGAAGWLPRPGPWMVTLRRVLGLLLLATAVWLVAVLDGVAGHAAAGVVVLLLAALLGLLAWAARRPVEGRRWVGASGTALVGLAVAAAVAMPNRGGEPPEPDGGRVAFDPAAIGRVVADGGTVLVDVSARWCLTCKVNELAALGTPAVAERLARPGTVVMRADWTRPDAAIGRYIQSFARYGIPLDVVYGPARPAGEALPELLTPAAVIEALDRVSAGGEGVDGSPSTARMSRGVP